MSPSPIIPVVIRGVGLRRFNLSHRPYADPPAAVAALTAAPVPRIIRADSDGKLPVVDRSGETLYRVSVSTARRLLNLELVIGLGGKKTIRKLQQAADADLSAITPITAYTGQHYSHDHDTPEFLKSGRPNPYGNPEGVWTLKRSYSREDRPIFQRVILDCMASYCCSFGAARSPSFEKTKP